MDIELEKRLNRAVEYLQTVADDLPGTGQHMDPVIKMMLVTLLNECQKNEDYLSTIAERIVERYCEHFIPRSKTGAMPAISVIQAEFKTSSCNETTSVGEGVVFSYKPSTGKPSLNYLPLFRTTAIPYLELYQVSANHMRCGDRVNEIASGSPNQLWIGIRTNSEPDCLGGLSIMLEGNGGVLPEHIFVGSDRTDLEFAGMNRLEDIEMLPPFDAQQSSDVFFQILDNWRDSMLASGDNSVIYIIDNRTDRDLYKRRAYPRIFQQWMESEMLDMFTGDTLWLCLSFPQGFTVPDDCRARINVLPVVNVDVNSLVLTQSSPMAKLQKQNNSFFLQILETSSADNGNGFGTLSDEVIVRDFDATCYHDGLLYRDVRNLYNHFVDDYYAFVDYNGIKDGESVRMLRELVNKIAKSVGAQNGKYKFDSGTYVMKNMAQTSSSAVKVSYVSTMGRAGNAPLPGDVMENKKLPLFDKNLKVVIGGCGGADKSGPDERYEQLRYFTMTADRLYTRKDIEAFLRKEIIAEFGKEEFRRIAISSAIAGAGSEKKLVRALYIKLEFKDRTNYDAAVAKSLDKVLVQRIVARSCLSMPVSVSLVNLDY